MFFTREAPVGEACLVPDVDNYCMGQRMMYFRPALNMLDARFLLHSIYGPLVRHFIDVEANGSTVGHLRLGQVTGLPLLWCPLEEQIAIANSIASDTRPLIEAIVRLQREIELLNEYRTRLIADVVTGKLDVREAAKHLPEEVPQFDAGGADEFEADNDEFDTEGEGVGEEDDVLAHGGEVFPLGRRQHSTRHHDKE